MLLFKLPGILLQIVLYPFRLLVLFMIWMIPLGFLFEYLGWFGF